MGRNYSQKWAQLSPPRGRCKHRRWKESNPCCVSQAGFTTTCLGLGNFPTLQDFTPQGRGTSASTSGPKPQTKRVRCLQPLKEAAGPQHVTPIHRRMRQSKLGTYILLWEGKGERRERLTGGKVNWPPLPSCPPITAHFMPPTQLFAHLLKW